MTHLKKPNNISQSLNWKTAGLAKRGYASVYRDIVYTHTLTHYLFAFDEKCHTLFATYLRYAYAYEGIMYTFYLLYLVPRCTKCIYFRWRYDMIPRVYARSTICEAVGFCCWGCGRGLGDCSVLFSLLLLWMSIYRSTAYSPSWHTTAHQLGERYPERYISYIYLENGISAEPLLGDYPLQLCNNI